MINAVMIHSSPFLGEWAGLSASLSVGCNQLTLLLGTALGL